jgi:hypothetical protein
MARTQIRTQLECPVFSAIGTGQRELDQPIVAIDFKQDGRIVSLPR